MPPTPPVSLPPLPPALRCLACARPLQSLQRLGLTTAQLGSPVFHRMPVPNPAQQSPPPRPASFDQLNVMELGTLPHGNAPYRLASLLKGLFGVKPLW